MKISKARLGIYLSIMDYKYSPEADKAVRDLLDMQLPVTDAGDRHVFTTDEHKYIHVWSQNRWYAYASSMTVSDEPYSLGDTVYDRKRPSRKTMVALWEYVQEHQTVKKPSTLLEALKEK